MPIWHDGTDPGIKKKSKSIIIKKKTKTLIYQMTIGLFQKNILNPIVKDINEIPGMYDEF